MNRVIITIFVMLISCYALDVYAIEKADRISDREIIEKLTRLEEGQKALNQRFDDMNRRFDDVMRYLQILTGAMLMVGGGILGWLVVIWKRLVRVEEKQKAFETQDDEIKFLKDSVMRLSDMVIKLMDTLKHQGRSA
ncbi:MAG: hypothetical protein Q8K51_02035 [Nitrospirota bacterium]|nr:hypothetical protein [Nitrospirota bacterium]